MTHFTPGTSMRATMPSTSEMMACPFGRRASNSSTTRSRPLTCSSITRTSCCTTRRCSVSSEVRRGAPLGPVARVVRVGLRRRLRLILGGEPDDAGLHVTPELLQGALLILLHLGDAGQVLPGDATGVEGSHGQLGARLADGLGGDDADRLAHFDPPAGGEVPTVAGGADALRQLAGERRTHLHFTPRQPALVPQLLGQTAQLGRGGIRDFVALLRQHLTGEGIGEVHGRRLSALRFFTTRWKVSHSSTTRTMAVSARHQVAGRNCSPQSRQTFSNSRPPPHFGQVTSSSKRAVGTGARSKARSPRQFRPLFRRLRLRLRLPRRATRRSEPLPSAELLAEVQVHGLRAHRAGRRRWGTDSSSAAAPAHFGQG